MTAAELRAAAEAQLKISQQNGWMLEQMLGRIHAGSISPGDPDTYIYWGNSMYLDRAGDAPLKLKAYQMGVVFFWHDGRTEHAVFDMRELWDDLVNPKPKQLSLWGEVAS